MPEQRATQLQVVIPGLRTAQNPDCEGRMPKRTFAQRLSTAELVMARRASRGCGE